MDKRYTNRIIIPVARSCPFPADHTPQMFSDKENIVHDIYRYQERYGKWPQSLDDLKSKLPDITFQQRYSYLKDNDMFVIYFQGDGLAGDDFGEFYSSNNREWKSIYSNRKEFLNLESKLSGKR